MNNISLRGLDSQTQPVSQQPNVRFGMNSPQIQPQSDSIVLRALTQQIVDAINAEDVVAVRKALSRVPAEQRADVIFRGPFIPLAAKKGQIAVLRTMWTLVPEEKQKKVGYVVKYENAMLRAKLKASLIQMAHQVDDMELGPP
jgi:hypothetical protein